MNSMPISMFRRTTLPSVFSAAVRFPSPSRMDMMAAAPIPTIEPNAEAMFISGRVIASPEIASAPTP